MARTKKSMPTAGRGKVFRRSVPFAKAMRHPLSKPRIFALSRRVFTASAAARPAALGALREYIEQKAAWLKCSPKALVESERVRGGAPALHDAAWLGNAEALLLFLQLGANANAEDDEGHAPLELTSSMRCAELLLEWGAEASGEVATVLYRRGKVSIALRVADEATAASEPEEPEEPEEPPEETAVGALLRSVMRSDDRETLERMVDAGMARVDFVSGSALVQLAADCGASRCLEALVFGYAAEVAELQLDAQKMLSLLSEPPWDSAESAVAESAGWSASRAAAATEVLARHPAMFSRLRRFVADAHSLLGAPGAAGALSDPTVQLSLGRMDKAFKAALTRRTRIRMRVAWARSTSAVREPTRPGAAPVGAVRP